MHILRLISIPRCRQLSPPKQNKHINKQRWQRFDYIITKQFAFDKSQNAKADKVIKVAQWKLSVSPGKKRHATTCLDSTWLDFTWWAIFVEDFEGSTKKICKMRINLTGLMGAAQPEITETSREMTKVGEIEARRGGNNFKCVRGSNRADRGDPAYAE